jgi:transcriptional regulator with XRE-family HTH domain
MPAPTTHTRVPSLRYWRIARYWTQTELAEQAGVSVNPVARGEQGKAISLISAKRLADALGTTIKQLQAEEPQS